MKYAPAAVALICAAVFAGDPRNLAALFIAAVLALVAIRRLNYGHMQIKDWRPHRKNTLQGFFTATLANGLILHDLIWHVKGDREWIGFPSREWEGRDGTAKFTPLIEFTDHETGDKFSAQAIAALKAHIAGLKQTA